MSELSKAHPNEYFSKDVSLLKSYLTKKALGISTSLPNPNKNNDVSSLSSINPAALPNKSQQTSQKVKELLWKTKQKLKLNKKTKQNNFESKMKAFSGLKSFIDTSSFIKNMNILNEMSNKDSQKLSNMKQLISMDSMDEDDEQDEEEPVFLVEGKPTTKFPRLKIKEELIDRAKGIIRSNLRKERTKSRYSMQENIFEKPWDEPEYRTIGKNALEIKKNISNKNRSSIGLDNMMNSNSKSDRTGKNSNGNKDFEEKKEVLINLKVETMPNYKNANNNCNTSKQIIQNLGNSHHNRRIKTIENSKISQRIAVVKSSPNLESEICKYLLEEPKLITETFEEKFIEDVKSGKFLLKWEEVISDVNDQKIQAEMKKFAYLLQNNKKAADKLKKELNTGAYENAFKDQAEKIGFLLKRAARNIFNQKSKILEENLQKKNQKLQRKVLELSEFMQKQAENSKSRLSKSKYSNISSRYNPNSNSRIVQSNSKVLMNNSTENLIEISEGKSLEKSQEVSKHLDSNSIEKTKFPEINQMPKSSARNPKSILKHRILSPIFLTDEKNVSISKIEHEEEASELMSPGLKGNLKLLRKKKSSLYEALNEVYEEKLQREEKKKSYLKRKNKLQNKELREKLERLLQDLDESKAGNAEERDEIKKNMMKMHEKWDQIDDKTKGVDALRLLAKDYKRNMKISLILPKKKGLKFL